MQKPAMLLLLVVYSFVVFIALHLRLTMFVHVTCKPLLCLFTTFKPGAYKIPVITVKHYILATSEFGDFVVYKFRCIFIWRCFMVYFARYKVLSDFSQVNRIVHYCLTRTRLL